MAKLFDTGPDVRIVFDVSSIAHRAWNRNSHLTWEGRPTGHIYGSFKIIRSNIEKILAAFKGKQAEVWFATDGAPTERLALDQQYKANRDHTKWTPVPEVVEMLRLWPGSMLSNPNLEADDIIAWTTGKKVRSAKVPTVIVSTDRDLWQLFRPGQVEIWCRDHLITQEDFLLGFAIKKAKYLPLVKALAGDGTDNVPCVTGSAATVAACVKHRITKVEDLLEQLDVLPPRWARKIEAGRERLLLNWKLVKLKRSHVGIVISQGQASATPLVKFLERRGCKSLLSQAGKLWDLIQ